MTKFLKCLQELKNNVKHNVMCHSRTYGRVSQGDSTPTTDYRKGHIRMLRHGDTTLQDVSAGDVHKRAVNRVLVI